MGAGGTLLEGIFASLYTSLGFRIAIEPPYDHLSI